MKMYLGKWELIPELSHYESGQAPEQGTYLIEEIAGEIQFTIDWLADGTDLQTRFSAPPNGEQVASEFPGVDSYSVLHEDDYTLSGDALTNGKQISRAMRHVSRDGSLMSILQENANGQGGMPRIFQVYRRVG